MIMLVVKETLALNLFENRDKTMMYELVRQVHKESARIININGHKASIVIDEDNSQNLSYQISVVWGRRVLAVSDRATTLEWCFYSVITKLTQIKSL